MAAMRLSSLLGQRRDGPGRPLHWTDIAAYAYLVLGVVLMFGPVLWLVLSSFKTQSALLEFPPSLLPFAQVEVTVPGQPQKLPLFRVTLPDGSTRELAQVRRIGLIAQMVDPANPAQQFPVAIDKREPVRHVALATEKYSEPLQRFAFLRFRSKSVVV